MSVSRKAKFQGVAQVALLTAVVALAIVVATTGRSLLPNWGAVAPTTIWAMAVSVLVVGLGRAFAEVLLLRLEWSALAEVERDVMVLSGGLARTAVGQRVAAVEEALSLQRVEREFRQSQRALAATTLSAIGTLTKFGSSALLVLAVMGTFAGMRSALPKLVESIGLAGSADVAAGASSITQSLMLIGEAFGANFVALFGSLVLAIASFGASLERRALLTSLELVSERRLYRRLPTDADASELQKAVNEMRQSVNAVADVASSITSLSAGIESLQRVLSETLSQMHSSFSTTMQQQSTRLQQEISVSVSRVVETLSVTTEALQGTSVAYQGLVRGLEERDLGVQTASAALSKTCERFSSLESQLISVADRTLTFQREALANSERQSKDAGLMSAAIAQHASTVGQSIAEHSEKLQQVSEQFVAAARSQGEVATAAESVYVKLTDLGTQLSLSNSRSADAIASTIRASSAASHESVKVALAEQVGAHQAATTAAIAGAMSLIRQTLEKAATDVADAASPATIVEQARTQHLATVAALADGTENIRRSVDALSAELRAAVQANARQSRVLQGNLDV
jgi:hypothetical protein